MAALVGVVALFELTPLDLAIQDRLFDATRSAWLVNARWPLPHAIFHEGPKVITVVVGLALIHALLRPERWRGVLEPAVPLRRAVLGALLTLCSVPLLIAAGKRATNMFCPSEIRRYGGDVCYVRLLQPFPANDRPTRRGNCFPAAHASGGFALLGLFNLVRRRRAQLAILSAAVGFGWIAGSYQILSGAHYVSHTLVSMILAWIVFVLWRRVLSLREFESGGENRISSRFA